MLVHKNSLFVYVFFKYLNNNTHKTLICNVSDNNNKKKIKHFGDFKEHNKFYTCPGKLRKTKKAKIIIMNFIERTKIKAQQMSSS